MELHLENEPSTPESRDTCPEWANQMILKIRDLEVELGNLLPPDQDESADSWWERPLDTLSNRLDASGKESLDALEHAAERAFEKVSRDLVRLGYSYATIAQFINLRLTGNSRLKYCDASEVEAASQASW